MSLTGFTPIFVQPPGTSFADATLRYLFKHPKKVRTDAELISLVLAYEQGCASTDLYLPFVLTQMVHETAGYTSMWSQPPRRNPAGIGVNGTTLPNGEPAGHWFPSDSLGVAGHLGRILAYAIAPGSGTEAQRRYIDFCLLFTPHPPRDRRRVTVAEVANTWAADPDYVPKLEATHAAILKA